MMHEPHEPVVFFDGYCNLCNASVQFLIRNDPNANLRFASLQSAVAQRLLEGVGQTEGDPATIVMLDKGQQFERSEAVLRAAGYLRFPWSIGRYLLFIPGFIRDRVYNFVARNRFSWFGRSDSCMVPTPENLSRFLPEDEVAQT